MKLATPETIAAALRHTNWKGRDGQYHSVDSTDLEGAAERIYAALPDQSEALREAPQKRLAARVKAAEDVCVMYGWSAVSDQTPRQRATHMLWKRWVAIVGPAFLGPSRHRDLNELEAAASAAAGEGGEG